MERRIEYGYGEFHWSHHPAPDWPGMAAAATLSLLPVVALFFFAQRYLVEGFAGAVKS